MIGDNSPAWLILSGGYRASSAERLTWLEPDDEAHDARIAKYEAKCQSDHDARLARDEARREAQAVKSAELARAKVLVGATGDHLGKLREVDVGVFQVTSPNSTDVSDYGEYDTSTLKKDVTAVVNVNIALS